jgi:hypothetical protein
VDDLYCKIYLRPVTPPNDLEDYLARVVGGTRDVRTIQNDSLIVDVFQNEGGTSLTEDFVLWPAYLEVEPAEASAGRAAFIDAVKVLLQSLRVNEIDAVAACDFEDELA